MDLNLIKSKVEEYLGNNGYSLYSIKELNSKKGLTLEIIVDRVEPISLDDIIKVSNSISDLLDEIDKSETPYTLDVSSLGAEKPIKIEDISKYVGKYISIHITNPFKGLNNLEGDLVAVDDTNISLDYKEKTRTIHASIPLKDIDRCNLAIKF